MDVERIRYSYGRAAARVLDDLTFSTVAQRIAVLGPNGAGKSTLMSLLSTVRTPSAGHFVVGEFDSRTSSGLRRYRSELGVVPQQLTAFGGLTCRELLGYVAWLREVPTKAADARIDEVIAAVGLEQSAAHRLATYSGGMRQRASLAQALVNAPRLLLLDEPTVSLDPAQRDAYLTLLRGLEPSTTIVMTSHVVDDVAAFADDVVVIAEGTCRFAGPLWEFCSLASGDTPSGGQVKDAYVRLLGERAGAR